ncbi:MAG: hypothetical protein JW723_06760 [Bacteroidales bacterium]|nr:hypothetical protein [Bacteroidales bacterium]
MAGKKVHRWSLKLHVMICLLSVFMIHAVSTFTQSVDFKGQLSGWSALKPEKPFQSAFGGRYIPELLISKQLNDKLKVDADISVNLYGTSIIPSFDSIETDGKVKFYRLWVRLSSNQFEARLGLQKINFGPSRFVRPLMWFDQIDPRDPLQITDGVYGILFRYYTLNNATFWLWGLYGNTDPKGWEFISTRKKSPEFGGRIQLPVPAGEVGFSYHHRIQDTLASLLPYPADAGRYFPENRIGIDGRWDIGIGLWFEGAFNHSSIDIPEYRYFKMLTAGMDYTFSWGNGLGLVSEQLFFSNSSKAFDMSNNRFFSALSLNYPLSLIWNITGMIYFDWDQKDLYRFLNLTLTYDKWSFYLMGFWNPEKFLIYRNIDNFDLFTGKGIQLMAVFNH